VATPRAIADEPADVAPWAELETWTRERKLPDGTPLEQLRLIAPTRDVALALRGRATAVGATAVLYADSSGRWWNPNPPGPWIE
jgi:hypothetical protein